MEIIEPPLLSIHKLPSKQSPSESHPPISPQTPITISYSACDKATPSAKPKSQITCKAMAFDLLEA